MQWCSVLSIPRHTREVCLKARVLALLGQSLSQQSYFRGENAAWLQVTTYSEALRNEHSSLYFLSSHPGHGPSPHPRHRATTAVRSHNAMCVKYEPSRSVGYIMLCSKKLSINSIDFMKNIGEKYFQTCFWPQPCTEPVLVLCCVCVKTCAVGQKCCVPCVPSLLLLGGNVSVDQGRTQQSSTESSKPHQLTVTVPSHELKSFPPVRLDHFITHWHILSFTAIISSEKQVHT